MAFGASDGHTFFTSWALWQKMTFVLACGIVLTIFLGFLKLLFNRYRLRKYSKVDKGKQTQTPEMIEAQPVTAISEETKDEIPFGIRAIQSGIEVDGVWISRSNTPVGSSRASIISDKKPVGSSYGSYNNSALELPKTAFISSSRDSSRAPSSAFDRAVSAERIASNNGSRASSPGASRSVQHAAPRSTNYNQPAASGSATASGPPSPQNAAQIQSGSNSKYSSRRTSDESDYMAISQDVRAYETAYIRPASVQTPIDPRTDLDALQTHRMSHVAETGQLTPRVRKPGNSGEWASVADGQVSSVNGVSYFVPQKTPSPPYPTVVESQSENAIPSSSAPTQPNHTTSQARQAVPLSESYAPKAAFYPDTYEPRGPQHQYSYDEVPYEVVTEQNQRDNQVLRTVNSGFQVLKPGTFQQPTPEELELAERRQSKKLQKKRRSSESRRSAFTEQV